MEIKNKYKQSAVLLPVYFKDKPNWLKLSVESVLSQSGVSFDLFLLCDGPLNDELSEYISQIDSEHENVKIFRFESNRGLPFVLNDGIRYGLENDYEYFWRMDADDVALPDRFRKQADYMAAHPETDVLGGAIEEIGEDGKLLGKRIQYPLTHDTCFKFYKKRAPLAHPAVLFRKSFFEKAGLYSERHIVQQDTFLWYQGFMNGAKFANLPDTVLHFRIPDNFFSGKRSGYKRAEALLKDRFKINKDLRYGFTANIYAFLYFLINVSPKFIKKLAYKTLR